MVYYENTILPRMDAIGFHAARPFESNKVECAERAISKLTLVARRKLSLVHTPCAELIVIGVFDRGRINGKREIARSGFHSRVTPPWDFQSSVIRRGRISRNKPLDFQHSEGTPSEMSTETLPLPLPASVLGSKM
jgi:hypothetical protein